MDSRGLGISQFKGVSLDATAESEVGLPSVPTAIKDIYARAHHSIGGGRCRTTIWFGDISDPNLPNLAITDKRRNGLKPYPLAITEGTGGGYGYVNILTFPKGFVEIGTSICRLMATKANTTTGTIAATFAGSFALGTGTIAAYATPTSTLANLITSATIVAGVGSVSGSTLTPGLSSTNRGTLTGLLDNSGGTASATIATFATGATVLAAHQNAIASLAAQFNNLQKLVTGTDTIGAAGGVVASRRSIDGTSTAVNVYFNSVIVDDATAAGNLYLEGRIIIDWAYISAVPVTPTLYRAEGQG
jgi:hypothetical protein